MPLEADIYPSCGPQIAGLIAQKTPTKVPAKYAVFVDIFSSNLASKLPKYIEINEYTFELVDD